LKVKSEKLIYRAGEHFAEPLIVEAGGQSVHLVLEAGAKLHLTAFVLAVGGVGSAVRLSLRVDLAGEGAELRLHGLFIASGTGKSAGRADVDVRVDHLVPDCNSRQLIKGIAIGAATGSFTGLVHVARDAQRTDASQRNQNLQLSDEAHVFASPQLEIYADDVKCSHGATVGRLDEEAVYYMRQRGVSETEARRMQMHGFAGEIVNHCPSEVVREEIGTKISAILDRF
jgi:Fe-S cluster assembly protein SufD